MFGLRLKSWMEAHLGRPRKVTGSSGKLSTSSTQTPHEERRMLGKGDLREPSEGAGGGEEQQKESRAQEPSTSKPRVVCNSNSGANILLGSFSNNLSSPDTGYSTDGYSPKSVYPALSFESSGKSTPKSSYTISSLVSSDLLNKNSASSNGLEELEESGDTDCLPNEETSSRDSPQAVPLTPNNEIQDVTVPCGDNGAKRKTHRRAESEGEKVTGKVAGGRNIRTSLVLSGANSPVGPENAGRGWSLDLKALSLSSPRRPRTRIKTNPWICIRNESAVMPKIHREEKESSLLTMRLSPARASLTIPVEINNVNVLSPSPGSSSSDQERTALHRISSSTSASDSGKGTLETRTNRNSRESSSLLSETTSSPRNSIISQEMRVESSSPCLPPLSFSDNQPSRGFGPSRLFPRPTLPFTREPAIAAYSPIIEKETDILSDWPNTDDEEREEQIDNPPSIFQLNPRRHYEDSPKCNTKFEICNSNGREECRSNNNFKKPASLLPYEDESGNSLNMNFPTTCYQPIPIRPIQMQGTYPEGMPSESEGLSNHVVSLDTAPRSFRSSRSPLKNQPTTIARGALGFLRKMFRKGSCSSTNSAASSPLHLNNDRKRGPPSSTTTTSLFCREGLADTVALPLTAHFTQSGIVKPCSPAVNGYFLTPTPNSFRRRSGAEASESRVSRTTKGFKTDIIRVPYPTMLNMEGNQEPGANGQTLGNGGGGNTNTNSTSASSVCSMSTSTSAETGLTQDAREGSFTPKPRLEVNQNHKQFPRPISTPVVQSPAQGSRLRNQKIPFESPRVSVAVSGNRINSPSFNNYSPIHRLVVTGGNPLLAPRLPPILPTHSQMMNGDMGEDVARTPRASYQPRPISSPIPQPYFHSPFIPSPSPILRNPRYQYITSSNQNSPLLNAPRRINNGHSGVQRPTPVNLNLKGEFPSNHYYSSPVLQQRAFYDLQTHQKSPVVNQKILHHPQELTPSHHFQFQPGNINSRVNRESLIAGRVGAGHGQFPTPEKIYETVDVDNSDYDEGDEDEDEEFEIQVRLREADLERRRREFERRHSRSKYSSRGKNRRSKRAQQTIDGSYPLMTLGPYLSETETRLLEGDDKETDRKYEQLISEAEALLREISIEKPNPAWLHDPSASEERDRDGVLLPKPLVDKRRANALKYDDCPQSDPLRRKAYDCWALRRLQQELAGCCASPPVLHRSRLNLLMTPNQSSNHLPNSNQNLSLLHYQPNHNDWVQYKL